jgi:hypothetical protein
MLVIIWPRGQAHILALQASICAWIYWHSATSPVAGAGAAAAGAAAAPAAPAAPAWPRATAGGSTAKLSKTSVPTHPFRIFMRLPSDLLGRQRVAPLVTHLGAQLVAIGSKKNKSNNVKKVWVKAVQSLFSSSQAEMGKQVAQSPNLFARPILRGHFLVSSSHCAPGWDCGPLGQ